jgi:glucose-1-phosphate thymidylyltransferase
MILAGGLGSRLSPLTMATNKHLLPIFDKPMIYYPLTTLILSGVTKVVIVTNEDSIMGFSKLLGDGHDFGIEIKYCAQKNADGLPSAIYSGISYIDENEELVVILGDNVMHGSGLGRNLSRLFGSRNFATILAIEVQNPEEFGVIKFDSNGKIEYLEEKPSSFISNYAIPGFYVFPPGLKTRLKTLKKSKRGETEIVDLLKNYLDDGLLVAEKLGRGIQWYDGGSVESLYESSSFVRSAQKRLGSMVGSPHEAARIMNLIGEKLLRDLISKNANTNYWKSLTK